MFEQARLGLCFRGLSLFVLLAAVGCDSAPESPDPPNRDKALECLPEGTDAGPIPDGGSVLGCASGEICVLGRCYEACADDGDCGPAEACGPAGACIPSSAPRPDAGPGVDAGPPGVCDAVDCTAPQVCHPVSGDCVDCNVDTVFAGPTEPGACPDLAPICDVANGECVTAVPAQCRPCRSDSGCDTGDGSFTGRCITRTVFEVEEQVCMATCTGPGTCPAGLECDTTEMVCRPPVGATCTTWLAATSRASCLGDADCAPLGASGALFLGACQGVTSPMLPDGSMEDGGAPTPGTCTQPCGMTTDCFDAAGGQQCLGDGTRTFCVVP